MRYKAIIDHGRIQYMDTIRPITHAVIGQRNEEAERPDTFKKDKIEIPERGKWELTPEQQEANAKHRARVNSGYYNMGVLDWFESEESAAAALDQWKDLLNVRIVPVTRAANG